MLKEISELEESSLANLKFTFAQLYRERKNADDVSDDDLKNFLNEISGDDIFNKINQQYSLMDQRLTSIKDALSQASKEMERSIQADMKGKESAANRS